MLSEYIDQDDPKLKQNFSYAGAFHRLKEVYNLPLYANPEYQHVNQYYTAS